MQYFKDENGTVWGFDDTQRDLIADAVTAGWEDITGSWPPPPVIPEITTVSMRQARLALLQEGELDDVEALITTREQHIWWDFSPNVEKYNPFVIQIKNALGWTDEYLTHLFELAASL